MNVRRGKIWAVFISFALFAGVCSAADLRNSDSNDPRLELLTDVHAGIEIAGVSGGDYDLRTARQLQFDIFRLDQWFMHFEVQEISLFDPSPRQLDHTIQYLSAGWQTDAGRFGLFWDHTCNNPARNLPDDASNDIRWNEIGISYITHGMRLGHENDGIDFDSSSQWLHKLDWNVSFSRVWMKHENDYDFMLKFGLRDDALRIRNHVFYAQFKLNTINSDRGTDFDPSVEVGDRIRLAKNLRLVPFASYKRFNDWYALDAGEEFFFYGLRLEAALGPDKSDKLVKSKPQKDSSLSSEELPLRFHVTGGYNTNLHGTHKSSGSSELFFDLDILDFDDKVLTLNTFAGLLTESGVAEIQNVNYKIGPSLKIDLADYYLRLFHSYSCLYGGDDDGLIRNYNLLGAELANDSQLSWSLQAAVFASTTDFDYNSRLQGTLGYDFNAAGITPYINGSLVALLGDDSVTGNAIEAGLKIPGSAGSFIMYLRLEDSYDVFRFDQGEQRWLGFHLVF
ncbi:MAG: hypothetical protein ABII09_04060 [Planctomycetota bacterium]